MSPAQTERTKLTANFMNSIASGTVVAALVGPFVTSAWELLTRTATC
ncbi:hypothetical protein [Paradevosia shaoguanensis]